MRNQFLLSEVCLTEKTHYFENVVHVKEDKLELSEDLIQKKEPGILCWTIKGTGFVK